MLEENLLKVLSIKEIFLEQLREIDLFTKPMALTYKKRYTFSTIYGVFFTLLTVFLVVFISIDNAVFAKYRYVCPLSKLTPVDKSNYTIDMQKDLIIFVALNDIKQVKIFLN